MNKFFTMEKCSLSGIDRGSFVEAETNREKEKELTKMKKFIESVCISEYEIGYMEINNSGYQFKMYRDCSTHYQSDAFWMYRRMTASVTLSTSSMASCSLHQRSKRRSACS